MTDLTTPTDLTRMTENSSAATRISFARVIAEAIAIIPHGCKAEAHRTTVCEYCTDNIAALRQLAVLVEEAGAITSALPNRVLDTHPRIRALLQLLAAGFTPATEDGR